MLKYNKKLKEYSRELRKNMTDAERLLWLKIKGKQYNNKGDYDNALLYYEKASEIEKRIGRSSALATIYENIADIHTSRRCAQ